MSIMNHRVECVLPLSTVTFDQETLPATDVRSTKSLRSTRKTIWTLLFYVADVSTQKITWNI